MASKMSKKIGAAVVAIGMATSIYLSPFLLENKQNNQYNQTSAQKTSDYSFSTYLDELQNTKKVSFNNKELYDALYNHFNGPFSVEDLRNITTLKIDVPFSNTDFSDLKYLTNLEFLTIEDNPVNCEDLIYNQNLKTFCLTRCSITNTEKLPNTIKTIAFGGIDVADDFLILPYNLKTVYLYSTSFNKLQFKNPSSIEEIYYNGYGFIDIDDLNECSNLRELSLGQCPNVLNSRQLTNMNNVNIALDEFCTLWLDRKDIYNIDSLSEEQKSAYANICNQLDNIVSSIINENMSEEDKINSIILYVMNQIEYDQDAVEKTEEGEKLLTEYNKQPIYYALNYNDGVCVGYATLFKALANRAGIDNYQPDSINHTWNMIRQINEDRYMAYDITALDKDYSDLYENGTITQDRDNPTTYYFDIDEEDRLLYYDFDLNSFTSEAYATTIESKQIQDKLIEIGYLKEAIKSNEKQEDKDKTFIMLRTAQIELTILTVALLIKAIYDGGKKKDYQRRTQRQEQQIIKYRRKS